MNRDMTVSSNLSIKDTTYHSFCPRIIEPFSDCYCVGLTSQKIVLTLEFCGGNYQGCEIYTRNCPLNTCNTLETE